MIYSPSKQTVLRKQTTSDANVAGVKINASAGQCEIGVHAKALNSFANVEWGWHG